MRIQVNYTVDLTDDQAEDVMAFAGAELAAAGLKDQHALIAVLKKYGVDVIDLAKGTRSKSTAPVVADERSKQSEKAPQNPSPDSAALDPTRSTAVLGGSGKAGESGKRPDGSGGRAKT